MFGLPANRVKPAFPYPALDPGTRSEARLVDCSGLVRCPPVQHPRELEVRRLKLEGCPRRPRAGLELGLTPFCKWIRGAGRLRPWWVGRGSGRKFKSSPVEGNSAGTGLFMNLLRCPAIGRELEGPLASTIRLWQRLSQSLDRSFGITSASHRNPDEADRATGGSHCSEWQYRIRTISVSSRESALSETASVCAEMMKPPSSVSARAPTP